MVVLSKIYTRTGDDGQTRLSDMSLTSKIDPRVEAYGTVDEANSTIGMALATGELPEQVASKLTIVQNELFDVGADLSTPLQTEYTYEPLRIPASSVTRLEQWCDELTEGLPTLRSFILPGGNTAGAWLHLARTVVRRAERAAWVAVAAHGTEPVAPAAADAQKTETQAEASDGEPADAKAPVTPPAGGVNPDAVSYLNRLSDLLFIASRVANGVADEVLWKPGGERTE